MPSIQSKEPDITDTTDVDDIFAYTWWDHMFDFITNHQWVKNTIVGFFVLIAIAGIVMIGLLVGDASNNMGMLAIAGVAVLAGFFLAIVTYRMTRYGPKHIHLEDNDSKEL